MASLQEERPPTKNSDVEENESSKHEDNNNDDVPLMALNHVSRLCRSVEDSKEFYTKVLDFVETERPPALDFDGAWLFNYGIGIHHVQSDDESKMPPIADVDQLDPMDNHISFQCEDMESLVRKLKETQIKGDDIKYIKRTLKSNGEDNEVIDQLFFNDPEGFMIEICNCENVKMVPAGSPNRIKLPRDQHTPPVKITNNDQ